MKKEIKFSLVYRDMWQSSGKYQPRADQLAKIAPLIVEMGCFARVETNGGAFEEGTCYMVRILTRQCVHLPSLYVRRVFRRICWTVV